MPRWRPRAAGDLVHLARLAEALKSAASTFGAAALAEPAPVD